MLFSKYYNNEFDGEYVPNLWYYNLLTFVDDGNEGALKSLSMIQPNSHTENNKTHNRRKSFDVDPDYLPTSKRLRMLGQEHTKTDDETNRRSGFRKPSLNIDSSERGSPINLSSPSIADSIENISEDDVQCTSTARSPPQENQESNGSNPEVNNVVNAHPESSCPPSVNSIGNAVNHGTTFTSIPRRLRKHDRLKGLVDETEKNRNSSWMRACEVREEDCHDIFGRNVACKLRSLPNEQRIYLEKIINDAIFEAEMRNLNRHCFLHVPNPSMQDVSPSIPQVKLEG